VSQLGIIYTFGALVKSTGESWTQGTALYYALNLDHFATGLGRMAAEAPLVVLKALTYSSLVLEWAGLLLILLPWPQPWCRRALIVGLGLMHLVTAMLMELWTFPYIMLACYALLLDERDWNTLSHLGNPMMARMHGRLDSIRSAVRAWFGPAQQIDPDPRMRRIVFWRRRVQVSLVQTFVVIVFASILVDGYNLSWARPRKLTQISEPRWMHGLLEGLQLVHGWYMFAPNPM
jgi:hypothetical protein